MGAWGGRWWGLGPSPRTPPRLRACRGVQLAVVQLWWSSSEVLLVPFSFSSSPLFSSLSLLLLFFVGWTWMGMGKGRGGCWWWCVWGMYDMWAQESGEDDNKANCMGQVSMCFIGRSTGSGGYSAGACHRHVSMDTPSVHELAKIILCLWNALMDSSVVVTDYPPKQAMLTFGWSMHKLILIWK
jgi:hypothetical protein